VSRQPLGLPAVILAADHRARGVMTIENYDAYLDAVRAALPACDGILASTQPLGDLVSSGAVESRHRTYLSVNRTGLAGSAFELDDRLVASVGAAKARGCTGIKHMTRIDLRDPLTAPALELLGRVLEEAAAAGLDALVEPLLWRDGALARDTDSIVAAAVIAHDMGAPLLKVPVPAEAEGAARVEAVARVAGSVGVPVLFLGGPRGADPAGGAGTSSATGPGSAQAVRRAVLSEVADVMAGGAAGMAIGRAILQDEDPKSMAAMVAQAVRAGAPEGRA